MNSFPFQFSTSASGNPVAYHFHIHGQPSEEAARDALVLQLEDLITQAKALDVSSDVQNAATQAAPVEPLAEDQPAADSTHPTLPAVDASMTLPALKKVAKAEGIDLSEATTPADAVAAIEAARTAADEDPDA